MDYKLLLEEAQQKERNLNIIINNLLRTIEEIRDKEKWKQLKKEWSK